MTNNLQVFLNLRELLTQACTCNPDKMKCDGDPTCCPYKKNQEIQGKAHIVLTLFTKEERAELNKIDDTEYLESDYSRSEEYQSFLEQERQNMISELPIGIIKDLGLII